MRLIVLTLLLLAQVACATTETSPQEVASNSVNSEEHRTNKLGMPRILDEQQQEIESSNLTGSRLEYLDKMLKFLEYDKPKVTSVKSLYHLIMSLQNGNITTNDLSDSHYYFQEPLGKKGSGLLDSTQFKCIQILLEDDFTTDSGEEIKQYYALYSNYNTDLNVIVQWIDNQPLVGQLLNVDFLSYERIYEYENKADRKSTAVVFVKPRWSGKNGSFQ